MVDFSSELNRKPSPTESFSTPGLDDPKDAAPPPGGRGPLPRQIKVDLDTPLEAAFSGLAMVSLGAAGIFLWIGLIGGKRSPPEPALLKYIPLALMAGAIFWALRKVTDNYYLIRTHSRKVYYHFEFLGSLNESVYLDFSEIAVMAVTGTIHRTKHSRWYEYQLFLVDTYGKTHAFSDSQRGELYELNKKAELIARVVGCRHAECPDESQMTVNKGFDGKYQVTFSRHPLDDNLAGLEEVGKVVLIIIVIGIALAVILFLFAG